MKNFVQEGDVLTVVAPYALTSGAGCQVGSIFGVAQTAAAISALVEIAMEGVFTLPKTTAEAWTQGAPIYWNNATKASTTTVSTNKLIGYATGAQLAGDTTGSLWLPGL